MRPDGKASLCFELLGADRLWVAVGGFLANKAWFAEQISMVLFVQPFAVDITT